MVQASPGCSACGAPPLCAIRRSEEPGPDVPKWGQCLLGTWLWHEANDGGFPPCRRGRTARALPFRVDGDRPREAPAIVSGQDDPSPLAGSERVQPTRMASRSMKVNTTEPVTMRTNGTVAAQYRRGSHAVVGGPGRLGRFSSGHGPDDRSAPVRLVIDVQPFAPRLAGGHGRATHQLGRDPATLQVGPDLGVQQERVGASVPRKVDEADEGTVGGTRTHPAESVSGSVPTSRVPRCRRATPSALPARRR